MRFMSKAFFISLFIFSILFDLNCNLTEWTESCFRNLKENVFVNDIRPIQVLSSQRFHSRLRAFQLINSLEFENSDATKCFIEKINVPADSNICVIGDIHGSIHSLLRNLWRLIFLGILGNNLKIIKDNFYLVFLGDYVDRGPCGVEVVSTLLDLKLTNWDNVFLLKGNHESISMNLSHGFLNEVHLKKMCSLQEISESFYQYLPHALFVTSGSDASFVQFCHGGLEPAFKDEIKEFLATDTDASSRYIRFFPEELEDGNCLNWMDFIDSDEKLGQNPETNRPYMGCDFATKELAAYGLKAIFRGHQHADFGLKIGGERHWTDFIKHGDEFLLSEAKWPIFTFSTAAQIGAVPYDCFGILTTADKVENWKLNPFENALPDSRDDKYVSIAKADDESGDLFKINWSATPPKTIIYEELVKKALTKQPETVLGLPSANSKRKPIEPKHRRVVVFDKKGAEKTKNVFKSIMQKG